jgi:hypothetical protein
MAYGVSQRSSELGIRMALGATPGDMQWLVLKQTAIRFVADMRFLSLLKEKSMIACRSARGVLR